MVNSNDNSKTKKQKEQVILKITLKPNKEYFVEFRGKVSEQFGIVPILTAIIAEFEQMAHEELFKEGFPFKKETRYIG